MKYIYEISLVNAGGTTTLPAARPFEQIHVVSTGAVTLAANFVITTSGTPTNGQQYRIFISLGGTLDLNGNAFTILGRNMDTDLLQNTTGAVYVVDAIYLNSAWKVSFLPNFLSSGFIETGHIKDATIATGDIADNAITFAKFQDFTGRGYILRGGAAGAPEEITAVTSGNLVMGNGTDVVSQAMSGDVTINGSGVTTIGAGKVTQSMLAFTLSSDQETTLSLTSAQILALNTTPITIVAAQGANKYIQPIDCVIVYSYSTAAYATNTTLELINESGTISLMEDTTALIGTVSKVVQMKATGTGAAAGQTQSLANAGLQVKVRTGDPTAGSGTIKLFLKYRIINNA